MKLYHFTSRWMLPRILREGITRGDVPTDMNKGFTAPWLTSDPDWNAQGWKSGSFLDKTEVRLTVKVDPTQLMSWSQLCDRFNLEPLFARSLSSGGSRGDGTEWYVHLKPVHRSRIKRVEIRENLPLMNPMVIPHRVRLLLHDGTIDRTTETRWREVSRATFVKSTENWVRSPDMRYPWSDMPKALLKVLANTSPSRAALLGEEFCDRAGINLRLTDDPLEPLPALMTMNGISRWLHSSRSILDISARSAELLYAWEPRFIGLPRMAEAPWRRGVLFRFQDHSLSIMMYMEPLEGDDPGVRYAMWSQDDAKRWGTVIPKGPLTGDGALDTYTALDKMLRTKSALAIASDGTRIDLGKLRHVGINALAALSEDPRIVHGSRKAPRKNRGRKAGLINRVRRLTLSYDGANMIVRRWTILPTPAQTEKIEHKPHRTPCLHTVQPHTWRVWVNTPKIHEKVLETRQKQRVQGSQTVSYTQYRVRRLRGKNGPFSRGSGVSPTVARIVTGPEDLSSGAGS